MTEHERLSRLVCGSVKRALTGRTPASLRAYSFAIDGDNKRILLRAHFGENPSDDDLEDISVIETEIDADFLDHFEGSKERPTSRWWRQARARRSLQMGSPTCAKESQERSAASERPLTAPMCGGCRETGKFRDKAVRLVKPALRALQISVA